MGILIRYKETMTVLMAFYLLLMVGSLTAQYQMPVLNATSARPAQPGGEIYYAFDGDVSSIYHSDWDIDAIPDTLTFYFSSQVQEINRLDYVPRQVGLNGVWTEVEIWYSLRSNPDFYFKDSQTPIDWLANNETKTYFFQEAIKDPYAIKISITRAEGNFSSCAEMEFWSLKPLASGDGCIIDASELVGNTDIRVPISKNGSYASSFQPGENIEKSFDGDLNTLYHSNWNTAYNDFPIELVYHFQGGADIDYLVYYPRISGYNGYFGEITVFYDAGGDDGFVHLTDFDFEKSGLVTRLVFPFRIHTENISLLIFSGEGGFASCAEMEFYKFSDDEPEEPQYGNIFETPLYDRLKPGVTIQQIDTMASMFYKSLAECIFSENYETAIRSRKYQAYESLATLSAKLKTSRYDAFENATGILFQKGEKAVLFADGIGTEPVYLRVRDFANEDNPDDHTYQLVDGLNVLEMKGAGLGYMTYFSKNPESASDIHINLVTGAINGYYDISVHDAADWQNMISRNTYKKIDVIGKYVHLNYDRLPLLQFNPVDINPLILRYDSIVQWQRIQMGLYKYDYNIKNRMLAVSGTGGGYYAGGEGIHLDLTWGPASIAHPESLDYWGIPHEFGHINQIRPGLNWIGTTEVTNNIYSAWAWLHFNYKGNKYTRLEEERFPLFTGFPSRYMNRYNAIIDELTFGDSHIQETQNDYPFRVLIPFWQLQLYYQLAGACRDGSPLIYSEEPIDDNIDYAHWYGYVAEKVRQSDDRNLSNGQNLLNFIRYTCEAVQENLSDFFIKSGMLRPVDVIIDDYGTGRLQISQSEVDQLVSELEILYPSIPLSPVIHYITALSFDIYREKRPLSGINGEGITLIDNSSYPYFEISHSVWKNAVAFESFNDNDELVLITLAGTGDISNKKSIIEAFDEISKIYALGYDGSRLLVYPKVTHTVDIESSSELKVVPTLIHLVENIKIDLENALGNYDIAIFTIDGHIVFEFHGTIEEINQQLSHFTVPMPQSYFIRVSNKDQIWKAQFICIQ